jgi:hypothetical protein
VVLHGHTHVQRNERREGVLFLNPGCVTGLIEVHPLASRILRFPRRDNSIGEPSNCAESAQFCFERKIAITRALLRRRRVSLA